MRYGFHSCFLVIICLAVGGAAPAQQIKWSKDGHSYYRAENGDIVQYTLPANSRLVLLAKDKLKPEGQTASLSVRNFIFSGDEQKLLIYTNTKKVWRLDTRGDYWLYNRGDGSLRQLGKALPASSLMFAKFSPDGTKA